MGITLKWCTNNIAPVGFDSKKEFSLMEKAFYAQKHCKEYLESGVTFIRAVGTEENYDL